MDIRHTISFSFTNGKEEQPCLMVAEDMLSSGKCYLVKGIEGRVQEHSYRVVCLQEYEGQINARGWENNNKIEE